MLGEHTTSFEVTATFTNKSSIDLSTAYLRTSAQSVSMS
jgi:hypothetical protein